MTSSAPSSGPICSKGASMETAYFAGGCFWCITPVFSELPGVLRVTSGYSGGDEENPSYEELKQWLKIRLDTETIDVTHR